MILTERDHFVLRALLFAVRIMAELHILDAWWPATAAGRKNGLRRLRQYCESRLLRRHVVHAKPVRRVQLLCEGSPAGATPDCDALARESRRLWAAVSIQPVVVYTATPRARNIFGAPAGHRVHALSQISHDLGCAALYGEFVRQAPDLARAWRSEDERLLPAGFGDAQPDAVFVDELGQPQAVAEFAADYSADRFRRLVRTFHEQQQLPYLIYGAKP